MHIYIELISEQKEKKDELRLKSTLNMFPGIRTAMSNTQGKTLPVTKAAWSKTETRTPRSSSVTLGTGTR